MDINGLWRLFWATGDIRIFLAARKLEIAREEERTA